MPSRKPLAAREREIISPLEVLLLATSDISPFCRAVGAYAPPALTHVDRVCPRRRDS
jgi:hypothetical protein